MFYSFCIPVFTMIITYMAYVRLSRPVIVLHTVLTFHIDLNYEGRVDRYLAAFISNPVILMACSASRVFSSMAVFDIMRENMHAVFALLPIFIQGMGHSCTAHRFMV